MTDTPHVHFRAAFNYLLKHKWTDGQKVLADKVGCSASTISEVKNGKAVASTDIQSNISNVFGYELDEFIRLGRSLVESTSNGSATQLPKQPTLSNVIQFNGNSAIDPKTEKMHRDLDAILQSGDEELIDAIRLNLMSFRKKVELQNQIEEQGKRIAALEASIK